MLWLIPPLPRFQRLHVLVLKLNRNHFVFSIFTCVRDLDEFANRIETPRRNVVLGIYLWASMRCDRRFLIILNLLQVWLIVTVFDVLLNSLPLNAAKRASRSIWRSNDSRSSTDQLQSQVSVWAVAKHRHCRSDLSNKIDVSLSKCSVFVHEKASSSVACTSMQLLLMIKLD